ncbi:protein maelstrom homolog [Amphiura filiformis]|uniref:protein maelstrom homolog n=1 Tax=Amphiura filiformis TaxID=82378 RepID=UPI003B227B16
MPPKKKNKNKPNGFLMYMLEKKHEFEAQEGRNLSMADLVPLAHPGWKAVPEAQKQEYNARAKQHDKNLKGQKNNEMAGKLDCTGLYVTDRIDGVAATKARRHAEYAACQSWPEGNAVCMEKFFMISFESLCEHKDGTFYPLELGCVEYSLCSGITNELHIFIDPGPIPMGYRFMCKARSESRHNIPIEGFNTPGNKYHATDDYRYVFNRLCNFINPKKRDGVYPPMFCEFERRPEVEGCLRWLCENAYVGNVFAKIHEAEVLFCALHEHAGNIRPSHSQAQDAFLTSAFDYLKGTRCPFHEEMETPMYYCALGKAKKNCYVLSDSLGSVYEILPTARHLPQVENVPAFNFIPHNQFHSQSRGQRRPVTMEHRYDDQDHRSRSPANRQMQQKPEPQIEQKPPEQQMRRPITMGKSGQIAGGMTPMRALEMGAGRGAPIQTGIGRGTPVGRGASLQNSSTNGKYAMRATAAPPPSALPPPLAAWQGPSDQGTSQGAGNQGQNAATQHLGATASTGFGSGSAASNSLSSDMATRLTLSSGAMPKGIGRGIGRGISRGTLYNGL